MCHWSQTLSVALIFCVCVCVSKIHCVRQLHHLPELAALQSDLLRVFPLTSDSAPQTIAQMLQQIPAGMSILYNNSNETTKKQRETHC